MKPPEEPRRLTPTERLHEVTMAAMSRAPSPPEHSVEISRNAKGVAQFAVTVRGYDLLAVLAQAEETFVSLERVFPYEDTGSDPSTAAARKAAAIAHSQTKPAGAAA